MIHKPPIVGTTDPVNNAVNVPLNKIIKIVFNEKIQAGSNLTRINYPSTWRYEYSYNVTIVGNTLNTLIITPTNLLARYQIHTYIPVDAIQDLQGNIGR